MSGYLLDTDVLSEVIKGRPEPSVIAGLRAIAPDSVTRSVRHFRRVPGLAVESW